MLNNKCNKYKIYYYDLFQQCKTDKPDLKGLDKFLKKIAEKDVEIYFTVISSRQYDSNYHLIGENKSTRLFHLKKIVVDETLFDCMAGCIYIMKNGYTQDKFVNLKHEKKGFTGNIVAKICINDIYECSVEVAEAAKKELLEMIEYYGESKEKVKLKYYNNNYPER